VRFLCIRSVVSISLVGSEGSLSLKGFRGLYGMDNSLLMFIVWSITGVCFFFSCGFL